MFWEESVIHPCNCSKKDSKTCLVLQPKSIQVSETKQNRTTQNKAYSPVNYHSHRQNPPLSWLKKQTHQNECGSSINAMFWALTTYLNTLSRGVKVKKTGGFPFQKDGFLGDGFYPLWWSLKASTALAESGRNACRGGGDGGMDDGRGEVFDVEKLGPKWWN